tara:strand:+ start:253 stop:453 length:201 start_codon:yes stop_codon:yes gene_type:complete
MEVTNGLVPDPPEIVELAIEIVTGESKPSASGETASIPVFTDAVSGSITVRDSGLEPSNANIELLE